MNSPSKSFPLSVHLNTEKTMRGGEVQCLGLLKYLSGKGRRCILATPRGCPLADGAGELSVELLDWNPRGEWDLGSALALRRRFPSNKPVLLHAHTAHALSLAVIAALGRKLTKVIATRRVSFPLRSGLSGFKYRSADAVVAVSAEISSVLCRSGLRKDKVSVIHSGVALERFQNLPTRQEARRALAAGEGSLVIGSAGALVPHKGHTVMLEALRLLSSHTGKRMEVLIAGSGKLAGEIRKAADDAGLNVRLLNFMEDLRPFYAALDVFLLPSLSGEGSPGVLKEAAACGVPVAASDVGGSGEILRNEREALLVPPGDVVALADAVRRLLEDEDLAEAMAAAARERVKLFTMEKMASAYEALYAKLFQAEPFEPSTHPQ